MALINYRDCQIDRGDVGSAESAVREAVVLELQNDPKGIGYSGMSSTEIADALMATSEAQEVPRWVEITVGLAYASNAVSRYDIAVVKDSMQ